VVYRKPADERVPVLLEENDEVGTDDALGFAYANAGDSSRLMIFGIGEGRRITWYQPAPPSTEFDPVAVEIRNGELVHEVSAQSRQRLTEGKLQLVAVFTNRTDLHASEVEAAVHAAPAGRTPTVPGCETRTFLLKVARR
jgi:hypothetical protein